MQQGVVVVGGELAVGLAEPVDKIDHALAFVDVLGNAVGPVSLLAAGRRAEPSCSVETSIH